MPRPLQFLWQFAALVLQAAATPNCGHLQLAQASRDPKESLLSSEAGLHESIGDALHVNDLDHLHAVGVPHMSSVLQPGGGREKAGGRGGSNKSRLKLSALVPKHRLY